MNLGALGDINDLRHNLTWAEKIPLRDVGEFSQFRELLPAAGTFKDALDLWAHIEPVEADHDDGDPGQDRNRWA